MAPSSINLADALMYEISYLVAVERIFAKVFSPTPLVGLEIDLSNAGLSELLKNNFQISYSIFDFHSFIESLTAIYSVGDA